MSYDTYLFRRDSQDRQEALHLAFERVSEADGTGPPDAELESRKRDLARAVLAEHPDLRVSPPGCLNAPPQGQTGQPIRRVNIELDSPQDGLQILISDQVVAVSVPYWHGGGKAEPVARKICKLLQLLQRATGFTHYDPQVGSLDLTDPSDLAKLARGIGFEPFD